MRLVSPVLARRHARHHAELIDADCPRHAGLMCRQMPPQHRRQPHPRRRATSSRRAACSPPAHDAAARRRRCMRSAPSCQAPGRHACTHSTALSIGDVEATEHMSRPCRGPSMKFPYPSAQLRHESASRLQLDQIAVHIEPTERRRDLRRRLNHMDPGRPPAHRPMPHVNHAPAGTPDDRGRAQRACTRAPLRADASTMHRPAQCRHHRVALGKLSREAAASGQNCETTAHSRRQPSLQRRALWRVAVAQPGPDHRHGPAAVRQRLVCAAVSMPPGKTGDHHITSRGQLGRDRRAAASPSREACRDPIDRHRSFVGRHQWPATNSTGGRSCTSRRFAG